MQFLIFIIILGLAIVALKWLFTVLSTLTGAIGVALILISAVVVINRRGVPVQYKPLLAASVLALSGVFLFGMGIVKAPQLAVQVAAKDAAEKQSQEERSKRIEERVGNECEGVIIRVSGAEKMLVAAKAGKSIDSYFDESRMTEILRQYHAEMSTCKENIARQMK